MNNSNPSEKIEDTNPAFFICATFSFTAKKTRNFRKVNSMVAEQDL